MRRLSSFSARFRQLSRDERWLLGRAIVVVLVTRGALWCGGFRLACRAAWFAATAPGGLSIDRAVWAVTAASRYVPGATCLTGAVAVQALLGRAGVDCRVHLGVAQDSPDGRAVDAHAWAVCGERIVIGSTAPGKYQPLGALDSHGHIL